MKNLKPDTALSERQIRIPSPHSAFFRTKKKFVSLLSKEDDLLLDFWALGLAGISKYWDKNRQLQAAIEQSNNELIDKLQAELGVYKNYQSPSVFQSACEKAVKHYESILACPNTTMTLNQLNEINHRVKKLSAIIEEITVADSLCSLGDGNCHTLR